MRKCVIVSSPGKLIIGGEHAVVYGRRALVTSIGMRLYMQLTIDNNESNRNLFNIRFLDTNQNYSLNLKDLNGAYPIEIQAIIYVYEQFREFVQSNSQLTLQVRSQIPIGSGLGSSAAFSVCLVGCFYLFAHNKLDRDNINDFAYKVECLFHGTPSGVDNTISTYGQSLVYSRPLKKHMNFQLSNLAIIDTGIPKSTKRMVDLVRSFIEKNPDEGEQILNDIEMCVDKMIECPDEISQFFQRNQQLLKRLGVSIPEIDNIIDKLADNSVSAKITGAGGGGCLIALIGSLTKCDVLDLLKTNSIKTIHFVDCGVDGLREEQCFTET